MNPFEKLQGVAPFLRSQTAERLTASLSAFSQRAWREIDPKRLDWNWHHALLAEHLELCYERKIRRLIITIPPRCTKSRLVSVLWPAWCWAKDPSLSFILTSYSDSLSTELSVVRRNLLCSDWFQSAFPGKISFSADQNQKAQYENLARGQMIATSMSGTMLGKGGDILIVDDALSPQQSFSDIERESVNRDFDSVFRSRLNEAERGVIVVVQQRLHERDLVGHLLESEPNTWTQVVLPMVAEKDEEIRFPISGRVVRRRAGDLLQPSRFPASWIEREKQIGSYRWAGQYLQRPGPAGGAVFRSDWIQRYEKLPEKGQVVIALDTAFSTKKTADFSAASVWVADSGRFYLAWMWRSRSEYPQLKRSVEELAAAWHPDAVLVEEKGSGQSLVQSLKQETSLPVVPFKVETDKVSRAHGVTGLFESGRVFFPQSAPWLADCLHELELFPAASHDDQVDSLVMALAYLREQTYERQYGWLNYVGKLFRGEIPDPTLPAKRSNEQVRKDREAAFEFERKLRGITQVNSAEGWKERQSACPRCSGPRVRIGGVGVRCNNCRAVEVMPNEFESPGAEGPCCDAFLPQFVSGMLRCGNCGRTSWPAGARPACSPVSRGDYLIGAFQAQQRGRF